MDFLLRVKAYQFFLLWVLTPLVLLCVIALVLPNHQNPLAYLIPVSLFSSTGIFLAWFYPMGKLAISLGASSSKFRVPAFKFYLFFPVSYFLLLGLLCFISLLYQFTPDPIFKLILEFIFQINAAFLTLAFFSSIYCMYYISMALYTALYGSKPKNFQEHANLFWWLWIFPIGIWFLQGIIHTLIAHSKEN